VNTRRGPKFLAVIGTVILISGLATSQATAAAPGASRYTATALTPTSTIVSEKSASGQIARSDPALLARTDTTPVNVMVKLDYDAAASYQGGVAGLAATSPQVTGKRLNKSDPAVTSYLRHADAESANASKRIRAAVPAAKVLSSFTLAYGGLSVRLPANQAKALLEIPGVSAVQQDSLQHPTADAEESASLAVPASTSTSSARTASISSDTTKFIGANKVWPSLGGPVKAGQGVIVGVLDTGIWPEHPSLKDLGLAKPGPAAKTWGCDFGTGTDAALGASFTCNHKLIGAYAFLDTNLSAGAPKAGEYCDVTLISSAHPFGTCSARDSDGHGTHTSTTAAGDPVKSVPLLGVDRGPISGIAPGASVIMYRVCLESGCFGSDSVRAIQQAILDGVNVINFSISGGASAYTDPVELAFLDAYAAGISVSASAGNSGPGTGTAEHAGPWVTTVAASTSDRAFESSMTLTSTDGATFSKVGSTITAGVTGTPVVLPTSVVGYTGSDFCLQPFAAGSLVGKVVVCERGGGGGGRVEKGYFASLGGAAGMILYNPTVSDTETDNHFLPAIHLDGPNDALVAFLAAHPGITATWARGEKATVRGDVMAGFSSRGPVGDFLKPDVTAPGVQVLAGNTPTPIGIPAGPPGQLFQAIAGTSMSSPHSAGISALVKAAHPTWTPGQIKSALMTSSVQDVVESNGTPANAWDEGAGSLRANRAVGPTVTFDVPASAYVASASDPLNRVDLNLPSINANPLTGALKTFRTAQNVSGRTQTFDVGSTTADGLEITVSPSTFTLAPNAKQKLKIIIDGTATSDGFHFASLTVRPRDSASIDAVLPVVVNRQPGLVPLTQSCDPISLLRNGIAGCTVTATNTAPVPAVATIKVTAPGKLTVSGVSAPAHRTSTGAAWSGTLSPTLAPTVTSIVAGANPVGGYLALSTFGIAPVAGVGDETMTNFTVPSFQYGGETYTGVGVDANGYVVVGGGTSQDNECCLVQTFPNPIRPNNVIAPFWTDLNPAAGGAVRVGTLTDGVNHWLVVDFAGVPAFGSSVLNTFEVWIQLGAVEGQWLSYGTLGGANGQPLSVGAENRDGSSGANVTGAASGGGYVITLAPPTPGGTVSFTYKASSKQAGKYDLLASLTTPIVKGTTTARTTLTVSK
jgi:hypothetical protein